MTLDDVAAGMRDRFTEAARQGRSEVVLTRSEWDTLASVIYLRDVVRTAVETGGFPEDKARDALKRAGG